MLKTLLKAPVNWQICRVGHRSILAKHEQTRQQSQNLFDCLAAIDARSPEEPQLPDSNAPVFILSAGWRSGSTLLQRLVCSAQERAMWGEPYGDTGLLEYLSEPLKRINAQLPQPSYFVDKLDHNVPMSQQWIANLYPSLHDLRLAYRAFYDRLFVDTANKNGYKTWGLKEVRLDAQHARVLRWLYPDCKIILLVRNPIDAWRSYAEFKRWYHIRPNKPVFNVNRFCDHWERLAASYLQHHNALDALIVRYEDILRKDGEIERISGYLDIPIDPSVLQKKIRSGDENAGGYGVVSGENRVLRRRLRAVAGKFDYQI